MNRIGWSAATLVSALAGAAAMLFPFCAGAEIYGWVDPSGDITYSNLPPPKNARVIEVIPEEPPASPQAQAAAAAAHDAEMKNLNNRVRQLERELQASRMEAAPYPASGPPAYGAPPPGYGAPPPYPSYDAGPGYGPGCDPDFFDCDLWDGPIYFTTGFAPWWGFRHRGFDGFRHEHRHFAGPGAPRFGGGPRFAGGPVAAHGFAGRGGGHASGYGSSGHGGSAGGATGHGH